MAHVQWPEMPRKRSREEEYADISAEGTLGFTEHRTKRVQALPLRTTPMSKNRANHPTFPPAHPFLFPNPGPHTTACGNSDSGDDRAPRFWNGQGQSQIWAPTSDRMTQQPIPSGLAMDSFDSDMDMVDASDSVPGPAFVGDGHFPEYLEPGSMQPDPIASSISGRIPTPIHCTFASRIRGNSWGGAVGNMHGTQCASPACFGAHSETYTDGITEVMGEASVPRSLDGPAATAAVMADWNMVQNRRIPSPISENGGEDTSAGPVMAVDCESPLPQMGEVNDHGHQHPWLAGMPPRSSSAVELGRTTNLPPRECTPAANGTRGVGDSAMDVDVASKPSPRRGHVRSKHTLTSWPGQQPGMIKSFSIGYRADCEKCQMKVPGHFNHIIIS